MRKPRLHYIIEDSKERSILIYVRDFILTTLVWILYFYFMRDLFYFTGDVIDWAWNGFQHPENYPSFRILGTIASYIVALCVATFVFLAWSFYNMARYGNKKRRKFSIPVDSEQLAKTFHVTNAEVNSWQKSRIMTFHHDARGQIIDVTLGR